MRPRKQPDPQVEKSEKSDAILLGEQAKALMENPYFIGLCERLDAAYQSEILNLHPSKADRFTAIQERRQNLHDLRGSVIADLEAGRKALASAQGEVKRGKVA